MRRPQTPLVKILVVGANHAGKTSLIQKFVFDEYLDATPTIGVNFAQKICVGEAGPLNLSIWDLSGQPRFRFLAPLFCSGASGAVLVFDLTRPDTLKEAKTWLELVSRHAQTVQADSIVLAGMKSDLNSQISRNEIQRFCHAYDIITFIPCSAKNGTNVTKVFTCLSTAIQRSQVEHSNLESPSLATY